jgi:hypothetical protein
MGEIFFMRLKTRCLLVACLLVSLSACASNNSANPQPGSANTNSSNSTTAQTNVAQPNEASANANAASGVPTASQPPATAGIDACSLLTTNEVAGIQGGAIKEAKGNQRGDGDFLMSQCFYTAEEFVRSVSLSVVQPNPATPDKQPREYFNEKFRDALKPKSEREKEQKAKGKDKEEEARGEEEEEKEKLTVERVSGLGEQAYWVQGGPSAALYVLKKNQFLILSLGGGDSDAVKLKKTKELAAQALKRLK